MKVTCPACGARYDLDAAVSDADARRFVDLVAGLAPAVAKPLIGYLALFRPEKTGLRWSRMLSLAQEIEPMIRAGQVTRNGTIYPAPTEAWAAALGQLVDRPRTLTLPLKSHGYLLEIIAGGAEKAAGKQEREVEQRKQQGRPVTGSGAPVPVGDLVKRSAPPAGWKNPIVQKGSDGNDEG